jgi:Uma2 family endonuclease
MVELKFGLRTVDVPYTIRIPDITEKLFDRLADEDTKAELIDGVMIVHSPATIRHDDVAGFLRFLKRFYAVHKNLGKVLGPDSLIKLATLRKFAPDWYFLESKRLRRGLPRKLWKGAPDLAGEILSPSTRKYDLEEKRPAYRHARVPEIWFIDLKNQKVIQDRLQGRKYETSIVTKGKVYSSVLSGFWIDASWLWMEPLPNEMDCLQQILA